MVSRELVHALASARRRMSQGEWRQLIVRLEAMGGVPDGLSTREATAGLLSRDAAWILTESFRAHGGAQWIEIAAAMTAVDYHEGDASPLTEIIWTGPPNQRFPVRRLDQVLYDLVSTAEQRIVLVTFAAHRVPHLCEHLKQAVERGVSLTLIVESEGESEGQLTRDAVEAFSTLPRGGWHLYYWPLEKRERNQAGRPGKLHMKCAIIDGVALIGSANLTDDAFNRNMELGILLRDHATVATISDHFQELIRSKVLMPVVPA